MQRRVGDTAQKLTPDRWLGEQNRPIQLAERVVDVDETVDGRLRSPVHAHG